MKRFIEAIDSIEVKCIALFLATSGLRKGEVLNLKKGDIDRNLRCIIPNCHFGKTSIQEYLFTMKRLNFTLRSLRRLKILGRKEARSSFY